LVESESAAETQLVPLFSHVPQSARKNNNTNKNHMFSAARSLLVSMPLSLALAFVVDFLLLLLLLLLFLLLLFFELLFFIIFVCCRRQRQKRKKQKSSVFFKQNSSSAVENWLRVSKKAEIN